MNTYLIGALAAPLIGLVVGLAVAWWDPDGYLRQSRRPTLAARRGTAETGDDDE